jgi:hypothetical protein
MYKKDYVQQLLNNMRLPPEKSIIKCDVKMYSFQQDYDPQ